MKMFIASSALLLSLGSLAGCKSAQSTTNTSQETNKVITVKGKITKIENGKDGYTATLEKNKNKSYAITVSMINLQHSGGTFKRYEVGQTIRATGSSWTDQQGTIHITATSISE